MGSQLTGITYLTGMRALTVILTVIALGVYCQANTACKCINPFKGTKDYYIGVPQTTCRSSGNFCYVRCNAMCWDVRPAKGYGRCYSKLACRMVNPHYEWQWG